MREVGLFFHFLVFLFKKRLLFEDDFYKKNIYDKFVLYILKIDVEPTFAKNVTFSLSISYFYFVILQVVTEH